MATVDLAPVFTLKDARDAGVRKDEVYDLLERAEVERLGRGVYVRPEAIDPRFVPLAAATAVRAESTLCLTSALVHHDLSDAIPFDSDIALPRGTHRPAGFSAVIWHSFDVATFEVGREHLDVDDRVTVAVYSAERTIVDCFRLMHREGSEVAHEALRRWLRRRGSTPASLLKMGATFPRALPRIRLALEALL